MTGKKTSNSLQSGLVWMPYIPIETVQSISNSNLIRKSKIENIFKMKNPT